MTKIIIIVVLVIILFVVYTVLTTNWDQVLKIEEIIPDELKTDSYGDLEVKITFVHLKGDDIKKYKITTNTTHSSGNFIQPLEKNFTEIIYEESTEIGTMVPVEIKKTEGTELHYTLNLHLYANDEYQEKYQIPLIVKPDISFRQYPGESSNALVFDDLDIQKIHLTNGEEQSIDFKIKQELAGNFDNVRVVPNVDNNYNRFIAIDVLQIEKTFDFVGEETVHSIPIKATNSEGDLIKYQMELVLLNNNELMDTRMIDVFVVPE